MCQCFAFVPQHLQNQYGQIRETKESCSFLELAKRSSEAVMATPWLPPSLDDDDIFAEDIKRKELEKKSLEFMASLIQHRLKDPLIYENNENDDEIPLAMKFAHDRFRDLTCTYEGEIILERLFDTRNISDPDVETPEDEEVIKAAIIAMQSLLILGMQTGVKGTPQQKERSVAHLRNYNKGDENTEYTSDFDAYWKSLSTQKLKHDSDVTAGIQLLAELKLKRTAQGAFDLLVRLGAWKIHEDLGLLRSGFPTRYTDEELKSAQEAANDNHDPDKILGIRKDLRHLKVYTIDSECTDEIDDGLSIEVVKKADGTERKRIWVHIADADRFAPRHSKIFRTAQQRATSLYLPTGSVPMFPIELSGGPMSLRAECDSHALSMAIELNDDGSIDEDSLMITPSLINVDYRLSYDEVDEMLEVGVGYFEEWELGALLDEANKRRKHRISCGSTEGFVPMPIPQAEIKVVENSDNEVDILLNVETTHNAGVNQSEAVLDFDSQPDEDISPPVSSAFLLVTEMMIMSGEGMGKLKDVLESKTKRVREENDHLPILENKLDLPYRAQPRPDFKQRYQELETLNSLKGKGYCHAWYARRFFESVRVNNEPSPHNGLGLDCYVQWTSPIRRFSDLQVHSAVKRFLRRHRVNLLMENGREIPEGITPSDLGCDVPKLVPSLTTEEGSSKRYEIVRTGGRHYINYKRGIGFVNAARMVQRKSKEYWLFEYIKRQLEESDSEVLYKATVLACVDPRRGQYAIFVHDLGLEHRYLSEQGELSIGSKLWLKVSSVQPRHGILTFTLSSIYGGKSKPFTQIS